MIQQDDSNHIIVAEKLKQVAIEAFHGADRDNLTLKSVREKVEDVLGLEKGILRRKDWKDESKAIVEHTVQQLLEAEEKEQKQSECDHSSDNDTLLSQTYEITTSVKKEISKKRSQQSTNDVANRRKRIKSKKLSTYDCNSSNFKSEGLANSLPDPKVELTSVDDRNEEQKLGGLNIHKVNFQRDSSIEEETECDIREKAAERAVHELRLKDEHNDITSPQLGSRVKNTNKKDTTENKIQPKSEPLQQSVTEETLMSQSIASNHDLTIEKNKSVRQDEDEEAMDSDMSVVIDEEPPEKRRRKTKEQKGETTEVGKIAPKNDKKLSSDEETIKKLQSQLRKCGVRTIWHFELKEYGEDTRAKIRHLQKALKDVGMQGRFSEARAREIKESRELMADLEAVKEGDMKWGLKRNHKNETREQNDEGKKASVFENSNLEAESDYEKREIKGKSLRNKTLKRRSNFAVQLPRQRSNALDWLGDEESSEG
ncbi:hypothetical protein EPUL_002499 [Erysiphe pulchra]|uniref:Transcriptional regulator n=1 Tax=Erysiphe pulchra TaxID=225359 RepID=A0A2S4Q104_9PEZI|nr:hypothetical protein EPUL_002499 [Erysiphe pulchra]